MELINESEDKTDTYFVNRQKKYNGKKYKLHQTTDIPKQKYQTWFKRHLNKKRKSQKPQYFQSIIKQQRKKMYIVNFVKKLKRLIVPQQQVYHQSLQIHQTQQYLGLKGYRMSLNQECIYSIFVLLSNFLLIFFITLSLAFQQIQQKWIKMCMGVGLILHIIQISRQCLCTKLVAVQEITRLQSIFNAYYQQEFFFDIFIMICFILELFLSSNSILSQLIRVGILFKGKNVNKHIISLQFNLIDNLYDEQIWNLAKMLILNFFFAHFSCIILILMANLSPGQNWITRHQLQNVSLQQLYVWAYYWAVTIMISLGFGDFTPTVWQQAMCIIFIQVFSCMFFAYNINSIGNIITKIKSYDQEAYSNMKIFNNYVKHTQISDQLQSRLRNYIKQSVNIKKQLNVSEENVFLERLPETFKNDVLKQSNQNIWKNLVFFKNLSQKMIKLLSIHITKYVAHPEEIIYKKYSTLDILIFYNGGYSLLYNRPLNFKKLSSNGKQVHQFKSNKEGSYNLLSLDFLFGKGLNFDVKSNDYTIVYKLKNQQFINCLKNNPYDFQYYCMVRDKDTVLLNQFQLHECELCQKQKHYLFRCPKLHYIPLKQHIIRKNIQNPKKYIKIIQKIRDQRKQYKSLKDLKQYKQNIQKYKLFPIINEENLAQKSFNNVYAENNQHKSAKSLQQNYFILNQTKSQRRLKQQIQEIYHKINLKQSSLWDIDSDTVHNFKYYFKKQNSSNLNKKIINKRFISF